MDEDEAHNMKKKEKGGYEILLFLLRVPYLLGVQRATSWPPDMLIYRSI